VSQRPRQLCICLGPECSLQGGAALLAACRQAFGDRVEVVREHCLGLCHEAPMALLEGDYLSEASLARIERALEATLK